MDQGASLYISYLSRGRASLIQALTLEEDFRMDGTVSLPAMFACSQMICEVSTRNV